MDKAFYITLLFIFVSALVGVYVKRRSRDRCLKDFHGFQVRVELKDGKFVWGALQVFPTGIELVYPHSHTDAGEGHVETSYIMLQDQLAQIQAIYRYHDELTPKNQAQRRQEVQRTYHPNIIRRARRSFRNFLNTFRDAINESMGLAMSRMKGSAQSEVLKTQDARLTKMGQTVVEGAANAYDGLYEKYIGHKVVAEELRKETWTERAAILKEYSPSWIEVLNWVETREQRFHLHEIERLHLNRSLGLKFRVERSGEAIAGMNLHLEIENRAKDPIVIRGVEREDYRHAIGRELAPGETVTTTLSDLPAAAVSSLQDTPLPLVVDLTEPPPQLEEGQPQASLPKLPDVELVVAIAREVDLCLPRAHATIRHGGEFVKNDQLKREEET